MRYKATIHLSYEVKLKLKCSKEEERDFEKVTEETERMLKSLYGSNGDKRYETLKAKTLKHGLSYSIMTREYTTGKKIRRIVATIKEVK